METEISHEPHLEDPERAYEKTKELRAYPSLRGAKGGIEEVRERGSHVVADDGRLTRYSLVLVRAALVLVACDDQGTRQAAAAKAADDGSESWDFSRIEFLAGLDPGRKDDWVRAALGEPSRTNE